MASQIKSHATPQSGQMSDFPPGSSITCAVKRLRHAFNALRVAVNADGHLKYHFFKLDNGTRLLFERHEADIRNDHERKCWETSAIEGV